jgi:glutaminase
MNYDDLLRDIVAEAAVLRGSGKVASYIPALASVPAEKFGIAVETVQGDRFSAGDADEPFSIQSISKVFALMLAMRISSGDNLWRRVGREPSGNPFNSLVQLEYEHGIPRNPFINAGALVVIDALVSALGEAKECFVGFARALAGDPAIGWDGEVARSEAAFGFINRALVNFLKGHGNIDNDVADVLDAYFHHCALAMTCRDLARAFLPLANRGVSPVLGDAVLTAQQARQVNSLMLTCGLYDAVGQFAYRVGLPAKSGVGGGIVAIVPDRMVIAVWSPELDPAGNSVAGTRALEIFSEAAGLSIF